MRITRADKAGVDMLLEMADKFPERPCLLIVADAQSHADAAHKLSLFKTRDNIGLMLAGADCPDIPKAIVYIAERVKLISPSLRKIVQSARMQISVKEQPV